MTEEEKQSELSTKPRARRNKKDRIRNDPAGVSGREKYEFLGGILEPRKTKALKDNHRWGLVCLGATCDKVGPARLPWIVGGALKEKKEA